MGYCRKFLSGGIRVEPKDELLSLLSESASYFDTGFSIDLKGAPDRWYRCASALGLRECCGLMAEALCREYRERFGREFLFTAPCVAFEIRYHLAAYLWAMGYPGCRRNITTYLFTRKKLILHCQEIDISVGDVSSRRQRVMFGYKKGVRPVYRNTPSDPFRRGPGAKR